MLLEKKLEVLKKYNPIEYYEEGRYIDAQDTVNAWCLAQIVQVDNKSINIHFDGWSNRWDVVRLLSCEANVLFAVAKSYFMENRAFQEKLKRIYRSEQNSSSTEHEL